MMRGIGRAGAHILGYEGVARVVAVGPETPVFARREVTSQWRARRYLARLPASAAL